MNGEKKRDHLFTLIAVMLTAVFFFACFATACSGKGADNAPDPAASMEGGEGEGDLVISCDDAAPEGGVSFTAAKIARLDYNEYGIMPIAEAAYTVTATALHGDGTQANVYYQDFDFTLAWNGSNSASISEYLTLGVPASSDQATQEKYLRTTRTVTCLKPFSTPIRLTVSCKKDPSLSSSIPINYAKRLKNIAITRCQKFSDFASDGINASAVRYEPTGTSKTNLTLSFLGKEWKESTPDWDSPVIEIALPSATDAYGTGSMSERVTLTATFRWSDEFINKVKNDIGYYTYGSGRHQVKYEPIKQDYVLSTNTSSKSILVRQYELFTGMATHMEQYIGDSARSLTFTAGLTQLDVTDNLTKFMNYFMETTPPIELTIQAVGAKTGATLTWTYSITPSVWR